MIKSKTIIWTGSIGATFSIFACWLAIELGAVGALAVAFAVGVLSSVLGAIGIDRLQRGGDK